VLALLCLALGLWSYRTLFGAGSTLPAQQQVEAWFFASTGTSPGLVVGVAAWLAWRRRSRLAGKPQPRRQIWSWGFFTLALLLYGWAQMASAKDLLLPSLAALGLGLAGAHSGLAGIRAMALPSLVLALALPIPSPLRNDIVWQLQLSSAAGADAILEALGIGMQRVGILLQHEDTSFLVIESCSGLRSLRTLTVVALVLRELFAAAGPRIWWLVVAAPPLALLLNVIRIAIIATDASLGDPALGDQHVGQGLMVLTAGTLLLFAAGHFLAGRTELENTSPPDTPSSLPWQRLLVPLSLMTALGHALPAWPPPQLERPDLAAFPMQRGKWFGEVLDSDRLFLGTLPLGNVVHRRYRYEEEREGPSIEVSLFIATESPGQVRDSPFSPKLLLPGRAWETRDPGNYRLWPISMDVTAANASSFDARARVFGWAIPSDELWGDSLRSLLALERGPFARERERVYVRLSTPSGEGAESQRRAERILDRFTHDFRDLLEAL